MNKHLPPGMWGLRLGLVGLAFILAVATYFGVEKPFRFGKRWRTGKTYALIMGMIALCLAGQQVKQGNGLPSRLPTNVLEPLAHVEDVNVSTAWIRANKKSFDDFFYFEKVVNPNNATTLFLGDSHAQQYMARIKLLLDQATSNNILVIYENQFRAHEKPDIDAFFINDRKKWNALFQFIRGNPQIKTIVLSYFWWAHFQSLTPIHEFLKQLNTLGAKVYLIADNPFVNELDPKMGLISRRLADFPHIIQVRPGKLRVRKNIKRFWRNAELKRIAQETGTTFIDPMDYLCSDNACDAVDQQGIPMYMDNNHLNSYYVRNHAIWIDQSVTPIQLNNVSAQITNRERN